MKIIETLYELQVSFRTPTTGIAQFDQSTAAYLSIRASVKAGATLHRSSGTVEQQRVGEKAIRLVCETQAGR